MPPLSPRSLLRPAAALLLLAGLVPSSPRCQDAAAATPPAAIRYMGREVATTMHWRGASWLLRETREDEENAAAMLDRLGVEPGMTVCDLGSGVGYHALRLARMVGDEGKVYAVDIQRQMLTLLEKRAADAGITNVETLLGSETDPQLPPNSCDLILLVDVHHEMSHPEQMLARMRAALKPDGRIAVVEFRAEDPEVPIKPLHKMSKAQVTAEYAANGFEPAGGFDGLPWQHLQFFRRAEGPVAGGVQEVAGPTRRAEGDEGRRASIFVPYARDGLDDPRPRLLHVFRPDGWEVGDRRPAVVFFFGGGWRAGTPYQFYPYCRALAERGMVAISAEYRTRGSHGTPIEACIEDAKAAMRFVRRHAEALGVDPERLAAGGGSAGGHLAASTALIAGFEPEQKLASSRPDALLLFNPAIDLSSFARVVDNDMERAARLSPAAHVVAETPPAVVFHGDADRTVPYSQASRFREAMVAAGNTCVLHTYAGAGHGFFNPGRAGDHHADTLAKTLSFLEELGWIMKR